ncbi:MAG: hypothetical protein JWM91_407 [Rhodospirillales bacterium]|nr:hypothetical protein [Rhodospirillales bacterium]
MADQLSRPLPPAETSAGCTEPSRLALHGFFIDLQSKLEASAEIADLHITRGMDPWGIVGGDLLEQAAVISNELRELSKRDRG